MKYQKRIVIGRRGVLVGSACLALSPRAVRAQNKLRIAALFAGSITDAGFMQAGHAGLLAARDNVKADATWIDGVPPRKELLEEALRKLAAGGADLVIAHGGQNNEAARSVAGEFPNVRFVVTQGNVTAPNLASYEVLQEHSAFLAGILAAMASKSGIVGHMSGIRVVPGLKGRAAFAHGVEASGTGARLLTNFSGNQDDNALSKRIALAMADAGADVIFTMLNAGRMGAVEACRERKISQIGNVRDWVASMPDVFIGSAIADAGFALQAAVEDLAKGELKVGRIAKVGIERPEAVRLAIGAGVPAPIRVRLAELEGAIKKGTIEVRTEWSGSEFPNPA